MADQDQNPNLTTSPENVEPMIDPAQAAAAVEHVELPDPSAPIATAGPIAPAPQAAVNIETPLAPAKKKSLFANFTLFPGQKSKPRSNEQKASSPPTNPLIVLSAGIVMAIIFILLIAVFIIQPTIQSITQLQDTIASESELLEKLEAKAQALNQAQRERSNFTADLQRLDYAIPNESSFIEDFKIIEKMAADTTTEPGINFVLTRASLSQIPQDSLPPTRTGRDYNRQEIALNLNVRSNFSGVQAFLDRIKDNLRNWTIDQVIYAPPDSSTEDLLDASIRLSTIYYAP